MRGRPVRRRRDRRVARRRSLRPASPSGVAPRRGRPARRLGGLAATPIAARHGSRHRARRALPRGAVPLGAAPEPPGVRRVGVLGAEGARRSTSSAASTSRCSRRPRTPSYPPLQPILDAAAFHAMGARTSSPCTCSSGSSSSAPSRRSPGCLHRHAPAWLLWPSLLLVLVVPRFGERLLMPQADVLVDVFVVGRGPAARPLAPRPGRLAARRGRGAARRCGDHEARGHPVRGCRARRRVRRLRGPGDWRAARRRVVSPSGCADPPVAALVPIAHDIPSGTPDVGSAATACADALRLSFEVLYSTARWSVVPLVATIALVAAARLGRSSARRVRRARLASCSSPAASGRRSASRSCAVTADESVNPIVRYTGVDRPPRGGCAMPLLLARSGDGGEGDRELCAPPPRRGGDRRRPAPRRTRSWSRADGAPLPVAATTASAWRRRARPSRSTSSSGGGTRGRGGASCSSASAASATSTRACAADGCGRWKVLYDGIESYEQGLSRRAEARGAGSRGRARARAA